MHETKSRLLNRILESKDAEQDAARSFTSERQHAAQAFALHVDFRDGLASEGSAWSHFARYRWADLGEHERLRVIFGPTCVMEILGHNLGKLVASIREGQLNGLREMSSAETALALHEGSEEPVILRVSAYPDFDKFFEAVRQGEEEHEPGFAGKVRR